MRAAEYGGPNVPADVLALRGQGMQAAYTYVKNKSKWVGPNMSYVSIIFPSVEPSLTLPAGSSTSSWTTSEHSEVVHPLTHLVRQKMKSGNDVGDCWTKTRNGNRRKSSKRLRPWMKRWKNDGLERLRKDPSLLLPQTRTHLQGLLEMVLHGAVDSVMPVSHSHHSGRGRDRSEAPIRAGARSACFLKILSRKKRRKRTLSAAARMSPHRVRMLQTTTLIAVR
jgi:hypothetical protein